MKQRLLSILFRLWLIFVITSFSACNNSNNDNNTGENEDEYVSDNPNDDKDTINDKDPSDNKLINIRNKEIKLTKHAQCRMKCRNINIGDVKTVLKKGRLNTKKSKLTANPPVYALEAASNNRKIRLVFADYANFVRVITVINRDQKRDAPECAECKKK
ncbi:MAG: DUF4258 domain-containing protein [Bacteroidia bacterium]|nr:DUF4258 domain-containing protein [Bacteroidia bacterium]